MEKKNRIRTALLFCLAFALAVLSVSCEVSSSSPDIVTARLSSGEDKRAIHAGKKTFRTFGGVTGDTGYEGYYVTFSNEKGPPGGDP